MNRRELKGHWENKKETATKLNSWVSHHANTNLLVKNEEIVRQFKYSDTVVNETKDYT